MIVVCGGIKGAPAKRPLPLISRSIRAAAGHDVLLVDVDDQETASDFTIQRNSNTGDKAVYSICEFGDEAVRTEINQAKAKYKEEMAVSQRSVSVLDIFREAREAIPDETWHTLPADLAAQNDHYIYGKPKRPA